ncbi:25209_t:CDS:2, partial [Gigaspora rosea]
HDVDKYPPSMNKNLSWPSGAKPCALLKKEHDIHWLNLLRDMFKLQSTYRSSWSALTSGSSKGPTASRSYVPPE